jgi:hypothetical protein
VAKGADFKTKSVILKLHKDRLSESLAVKTTCFTKYLSYLNPKGKVSSCNIDGFMATYISKSKMTVAGLMFEPHPPNFEKLYNF